MQKIDNRVFGAKLIDKEILARGVVKFSFKMDRPFVYLPGQYVWLELLEPKATDPKGNRRAFSICNLPGEENVIELIGRMSESGYKQDLFALDVGAEVKIHGPFGCSFVLKEEDRDNLVLIAGGVGIAPFLAIIEKLKLSKSVKKCFLVYLNRDPQTTPFLKLLAETKRNWSNFDYLVSYENFAWSEIAGEFEKLKGETKWWITGPEKMVEVVHQELVNGGISRLDMVFENFYPSSPNNLTLEKVREDVAKGGILTQAIENSTNHTVITDANGVVLYANKAAEKTTGYSQQEIIGNTPRLWGGMMSEEFYKEFWSRKASGKPFEGEILNRRKNGELYYTIGHIAPITDGEKNVIGYIGTEEDITVMKEQELKIKENEQRLKFALEGSRDGLWDWNIATQEVYFSPRWKEMLGFKEEEIESSLKEWEKRVHPEDLPEVSRIMQDHLESKTPFYESQHRVRCKDGRYIWILDRGMVVERDEKGKALRAVGTHTDVTETKEREDELERMNKAMVNRELKMIELKEKVKELEEKI